MANATKEAGKSEVDSGNRVAWTEDLRRINESSMSRPGCSRILTEDLLDQLDDSGGPHIVGAEMDHGDGQALRCRVACRVAGVSEPVLGWIDMAYERYLALETVAACEARQTDST